MKFSIITATYNCEKTLEKSIQCIINQSYKNFEYIIIDGASKDKTVDIIKQYQHQITYWISEKDKGIYDAWNKGVQVATGDWIIFLGADDYYHQDALQNYFNFIVENKIDNKECLYLSSKVNLIDETGKSFRLYGWPWQWHVFKSFNIIAHPGSLQSTHLFKQFGLYDTNLKIVADYDLLLRPKQHLNAKFMNIVTADVSDGGVSTKPKVFKEIRDVLIKQGTIPAWKAHVNYYVSVSKLLGKKWAKKLGLNLYLRKSHQL